MTGVGRTVAAWAIVVAVVGCTGDNPAFAHGTGTDSGGGSSTTADSGPYTSGDTSGDTSGVTSDTSGGSGSTGGSTTGGPARPPPLDCANIHDLDPQAPDGVYEIDLDGPESMAPFDVWCDMTMAGGGWTLVYAYGFTNYANFGSSDNAVSVRPTWGISPTNPVPESTTVPLGLTDFGAMDFARWKELGTSFLVRTNITNSVACDEAGGSLVNAVEGSIDCTLVEVITPTCTDVVPNFVGAWPGGMIVSADNLYYYWDASLEQHWPAHDPCGTNAGNQLPGVAEPLGAILIRR